MTAGTPRGRSYPPPVRAAKSWATKLHTALFGRTGGRVGGQLVGNPVLLLNTTGRKTGKGRTTPLLYLPDGEDMVIVASDGGAAKHPAWWLNLREMEEATVEVGDRRVRVRAEEVSGEEKRRLWARLVGAYPPYASYQEKTEREIPVVVLRPSGNEYRSHA
jgi:deazaflavin-dependent oxidoreductase (nitroreductase family)